MDQNISYFNGFLESLSLINCKANLVSSFYLENKSMLPNLDLTKNIAQFYPENYIFELDNIENWEKKLKNTFVTYFFRFTEVNRSRSDFQKIFLGDSFELEENLTRGTFRYLHEIVGDDVKVYIAKLSHTDNEHYENEYCDIFFVGNSEIYFLHLGISD